MNNKLLLCFIGLSLLALSCDKDNGTSAPVPPTQGGGNMLPGNCNVELVTVNKITEDEVTDGAEIGDYFITIKNINTIKEKISLEVRYFIGRTAVATVMVSTNGSVGIDETIEFKISSDSINTEEDWNCIQYFMKAEAEGSPNCEWDGNDC